MTETLISVKNPLLKEIRRAVARGSLTADGFAVCEGFHLLEEALKSNSEIGAIVVSEPVRNAVTTHVRGLKRTPVVSVAERTFAELASTEATQGVIALVKPPEWTIDQLLRGKSLVLVLDGIQDPGNAGAIVRAAEAFGASGAAFLKGTVSPYNPKALRATAGSIFRLPIVSSIDDGLLLAALDQHRIAVYAAMPRAPKPLAEADLSDRCAIVIGAEGRGVNPAISARATGLRIPISAVESLNAAVAAGVMLYEARRQRTLS